MASYIIAFIIAFQGHLAHAQSRSSGITGSAAEIAQCVYDSDCANDLVCKWGRCVSVCKNNKDCKEGEYCALKYKYGEPVPSLFSATACIKTGESSYQDLGLSGVEAFQHGSNYWGHDYREFPIKEEGPAICYRTCKDDPRCQAWAYIRPRVVADSPYCVHKEKIGQLVAHAGMVSGIIDRK